MQPFLKYLSRTLFPRYCILCNGHSQCELDICTDCKQELPWLARSCYQCANPLPPTDPTFSMLTHCANCLNKAPPYDRCIAAFYYEQPIKTLITQLKFTGKLHHARLLSNLLLDTLRPQYQESPLPQLIVPVPLHQTRQQQRGYNQALEIAKVISKQMDIKIDYKSILRHQHTQAQSKISAKQRKENMKDAFSINKALRANHIALVDDVITTGATINALAGLIKNLGVNKIDVWCCARTPFGKHGHPGT